MDADIQKLFDDLAEQKRAEKQKKHEAGIFNALTEPGLKAKKAKIEEELIEVDEALAKRNKAEDGSERLLALIPRLEKLVPKLEAFLEGTNPKVGENV